MYPESARPVTGGIVALSTQRSRVRGGRAAQASEESKRREHSGRGCWGQCKLTSLGAIVVLRHELALIELAQPRRIRLHRLAQPRVDVVEACAGSIIPAIFDDAAAARGAVAVCGPGVRGRGCAVEQHAGAERAEEGLAVLHAPPQVCAQQSSAFTNMPADARHECEVDAHSRRPWCRGKGRRGSPRGCRGRRWCQPPPALARTRGAASRPRAQGSACLQGAGTRVV